MPRHPLTHQHHTRQDANLPPPEYAVVINVAEALGLFDRIIEVRLELPGSPSVTISDPNVLRALTEELSKPHNLFATRDDPDPGCGSITFLGSFEDAQEPSIILSYDPRTGRLMKDHMIAEATQGFQAMIRTAQGSK